VTAALNETGVVAALFGREEDDDDEPAGPATMAANGD